VTPTEAVRASRHLVAETFMLDPATRAAGRERGLRSWPAYYVGRGGVLGDVAAEVVEAAFVFLPAASVAKGWAAGTAVLTPEDGAQLFGGLAASWGRDRLAALTVQEVGRLAVLAAAVVDAAPVGCLPLFAGWRAQPRPADAAGCAGLLLHCLRELRGGLHGVAVVAAGLDPVEAIVAGPYGEDNAAWFGWTPPYPAVTPELAARWAAAEEVTVARLATAYSVLSRSELAELAALTGRVGAVHA